MDDVIYRQGAVDKFEPWIKVKGYNEGELNMLKAVLYELKCLPSAMINVFTGGDFQIYSTVHYMLWAAGFLLWLDLAVLLLYLKEVD